MHLHSIVMERLHTVFLKTTKLGAPVTACYLANKADEEKQCFYFAFSKFITCSYAHLDIRKPKML